MATGTATLDTHLRAALGGDGPQEARRASALRLRVRLQPAGGPGAKVMPPTYSGENDKPMYVKEDRLIDGEARNCMLLDSVQSQGNRFEEVLAWATEAGLITLPIVEVDQQEFGRHTPLVFPHRIFDAWVEDALLGTERFGNTDRYKRLASSSRHDLTALMETFPVGIVLGCWASRQTNPQGTTRLARILTSEILAVDAIEGVRAAGRIDRHHVSSEIPVYDAEAKGDRVTLNPEAARKEKNKPVLHRDKGKPSEAGYGNIAPSVAPHGGITMDHALQIATISLPALRECSFPLEDGARKRDRDLAGANMLVALAVTMLALQVDRGYDLRSGCLLVPEEDPKLELVGRRGTVVTSWPLDVDDALELLNAAVAEGAEHGLVWDQEPLQLEASEMQLELLRRSLDDPSSAND